MFHTDSAPRNTHAIGDLPGVGVNTHFNKHRFPFWRNKITLFTTFAHVHLRTIVHDFNFAYSVEPERILGQRVFHS